MTERLQRTSCRLDRPRNKLFSRAAGTIGLRSLVLPHLGNISGHKLGIFRDFYFIGLLFCLQQSNCIVCIFWDNSSTSFICFTEKIIIKNNFSTFPLIYVAGVFITEFLLCKILADVLVTRFFFFSVVCELKSSSLNICSVFGKKKTLFLRKCTKPQHCHHQASHNIYCECLY